MNRITVKDIDIRLDQDYISLTDIAKKNSNQRVDNLISSWMKNTNTLLFLQEWEEQNNPHFKSYQMVGFIREAVDNRNAVNPSNYIKATNAVGIVSKRGKYGGTYAHPQIALFFCYWLSPPFAVWMVRTFERLITEESQRKSLEFHISKITDHIEEARNWLDTIPYQDQRRNRMKLEEDKEAEG